MISENLHKSTIESKLFKIPIKDYVKDMETEAAKGKKNEILDLLHNYNKLRSEEEFEEISYNLHEACSKGDLDLIKIYLSENIIDYSNTLHFKIDETNRTASLFNSKYGTEEVIIPRTVEHNSVEYLITSVSGICKDLKTLKFAEDSAVETIYGYAVPCFSEINEIYFPASLKELKEGWFYHISELTKITISPLNGQFKFIDDKYLVGKSDSSKDEFDILLFACRNIEEIFIPSNIKIISSYAFNFCRELAKVEFETNSNLQTIEKYAFSYSNINEIYIPSKVSKICEYAFYYCYNLTKVEIPTNSNLQTIESNAFSLSSIEELYFPTNLKELKEGWCFHTNELTKITVSPLNGQFKFIDDKYLVGKSDSSKDEFDILLFACRDIEEIFIPSNIKIISSYAFNYCGKLAKVEFETNSNLQTIESNAFSYSNINEIYIPSKVSKICEYAFFNCSNLTIVGIPTNSNLQIIESNAFSESSIIGILIPPKVSKICKHAFYKCSNLIQVGIPLNSNLQIIESNAFKESNIKEIFIPPKVSKICKHAFEKCSNLTKVEIPKNSNLQTIEKYAFAESEIKEIFIPSKVSIICEFAFHACHKMKKVKFETNSNLQTIESNAFASSGINEIIIPSKVSKICENAFSYCINLVKVEIPTNSNLQAIGSNAFGKSHIKEIYLPANLKELCCLSTMELTKITVSPSNGQFMMKEDKYLVGKSDSSKDEFDILLFACRNIKEIFIPSNIKIISSCAFNYCGKLTKVEFETNSNLQTIEEFAFSDCKKLTKVEIPTKSNLRIIEKCAFSFSKIKAIFIPSNVSKICEGAFEKCTNLQIIEISEESKLESFPLSAFNEYSSSIIMVPAFSLEKLISSPNEKLISSDQNLTHPPPQYCNIF